MRILICNDDGTSAPGLAMLGDAARALSPDVWVVAPERKWTAASHQLSLDRLLTLTRIGERAFACSGGPADCVVAAMTLLFGSGPKPDLVLAGLNDKINVGEDVAYSGTMAIAREAAFWNVPAISLSRDEQGVPVWRDAVAIGNLLGVLWQDRTAWAEEGCWLALNLPMTLPAPLVQAGVGRDKIAGACETIESTAERITFRIARGRPGTHRDGDERSVVAAGRIAMVRHRWFDPAPVAATTVDGWNRLLR